MQERRWRDPCRSRITDAAVRAVVRGYTCESGVRHLLRLVGAVCEEVACRRVTTGDTSPVLIVAHEREGSDAPAARRLTVDQVLGPAQHETVPDAVRDVVAREQERLMALPRADPEAARAIDWIEVVTDLPWKRRAARVDGSAVKAALDRAHIGCEEQKQRLLDHLAAGDAGGAPAAAGELPCLRGPSGVGKTALARSLAAALGRGFVEVSLAGVRDAEAVRGIARPPARCRAGMPGGRPAATRRTRPSAGPRTRWSCSTGSTSWPRGRPPTHCSTRSTPTAATCFATTTSDCRSTCRQ